jgi:hypothetical protein
MLAKPIAWRDEKLYKIRARDYGDLPQRILGLVVYMVVKGAGFALMVVLLLLSPRLFSSPQDWYTFFPPLVAVCAVGVGIVDRSSYVCEIEIFPDRIIRHSGGRPRA